MKFIAGFTIVCGVVLLSTMTNANDDLKTKGKQPVELGQVTWHRDLDAAKKKAAKYNRPIFLLFQEVPG